MAKERLEGHVSSTAKQHAKELVAKTGFPSYSDFLEWLIEDYYAQICLPATPLPAAQQLETKEQSPLPAAVGPQLIESAYDKIVRQADKCKEALKSS